MEGQRKIVGARQQALFSLPILGDGDFAVLEAMHARLGTFIMEWTNWAGSSYNEREGYSVYTMLMNRLEGSYQRKYLEWLVDKPSREEGLVSVEGVDGVAAAASQSG